MTNRFKHDHTRIVKRSGIIFLVALLFFLISEPPEIYAHHRSKVLGASTFPSDVTLPPTVEGPGFILPDSPLFFLDTIKQNIRLFVAVSPEAKAKVHAQIAGERVAELRFMLAKNNAKGIEITLESISSNIKQAGDQIERAQLAGRNVEGVAKVVNLEIKAKQETLDALEKQTDAELKAKVQAVSAAVLESKVKVEDGLSDDELEQEIEDDLLRNISRNLDAATDSARDLEEDLNELSKQHEEAGKKSLKRREEALKKAIEEKNEELKKDAQRFLEFEKKKNDELMKLEAAEAEKVRETVRKAQETAASLKNATQKIGEIKSQSAESSNTSSASSGSGSSSNSNSGSGSSSSGSSESSTSSSGKN